MGDIVLNRGFDRTPLEIAMDGGFRPPAEARKIEKMLERVTGAIKDAGVAGVGVVVFRTLRHKEGDK